MKNANIRLVLLAGMASAASTVNGQTLDETRGYAAELLADAEQRTSLLGAPTSAWTGNNFQLGNADGTFIMNISAYNQTRANINISDDSATSDGFETGFNQPRTRLIFDGNVVNPDTFYRIEIGFDSDGGGFSTAGSGVGTLLDAYFGHRFSSGLTVSLGQRKIDLLRSYNQASNRDQLIEGTAVGTFFAIGRSQGLFFEYEGEQGNWRYSGAFTDGAVSQNTDFTNPTEADWSISNRFDFAVDGDLDAFSDSVRLFPGGDGATILGANFHIQQSANQPGAPQVTLIQWGGDVIFQSPDGWNIFAEFVHRYIDTTGGATLNDFGVAVQGGFFINEQTEIAGAWDILLPDDDRPGANVDPFNTLQANVNYWPFAGSRAVKLSAGAIIFVNNPTETGGLAGTNTWLGLLASDSDGQVGITGQGQIEL
ncbi:MAG: porin [Planctomycetota bacterium]